MGTDIRDMRDIVTFDWPRNPFPGLRPFREDEALIFYGRNSHKDEVLARLNNSQLVFVTGPSGCGKSSLIKAGVLPALQAGLLTKAGYHWKTLQMRPGRRPLANLAAAFKSTQSEADTEGEDRQALDTILKDEGSGLWLAASAIAPLQKTSAADKAPVRLLLLIDQFEEIFGEQIQEPADVDHFVRLLVRFSERPHPNLFIIVTLRSDYLGQCANFEGLAESINRTQFLTPVLTQDELGQAIARPAEDYNGDVEPQLVEQIIRDMRTGTAYHPDSLPLMQHALLWMWSKAWMQSGATEPPRPPFNDGSNRTQLTLKSYQDNGGIEGILDRHAEDVMRQAVGESEKSRAIAESLFRRLSERDSEGRYRRSPTSSTSLCSIAGCELEELQHVIRPFEHPDVCFLEQRRSESTNEVLVDVSHESLIRQWNTAKAWADAEAEKVRKFRDLAHAAQTWERRKRSHDFLKRRGELEVIKAWWDDEAPNENWARRYALGPEGGNLTDVFHLVDEYVRESSSVDQAEQAAAERSRIEQASEKSRRQRNRYFAIAVFLLLVSAFVGVLLLWQTNENNAFRVRVTALLADEALKVFGPARALLAVMEGIDDSLPELPEIRRVGYRALAQLRERRILEGHAAQVQSVQFAPQQPGLPSYLLITTSNDGHLRFWNTETGELIGDIFVPSARFLTARWSPDGKRIFVSARDIEAFLLVPCSQEKLRSFFEECTAATEDKKRPFGQRVGGGSFSPDSRWIITGGFNATTKLWNVASENIEKTRDFGRTGSFTVGAAFSHDAQRLALGAPVDQDSSGGEIRIFRLSDLLSKADARPEITLNRPPGTPPTTGPRALVTSLVFHPTDPNVLLVTYQDGTIKWLNAAKNEEKILRVERGAVFQGVFNHDGEWAATAHEDGIVRLWPLRAAQPTPQMLLGHQGSVYTVAYSPDGTTIASGSSDRTARIWSQQSALSRVSFGTTVPPDTFATGKASARERAGQLILTYNNTDFTLNSPSGFREPTAAAVSPSGKDAVVAPKRGRPYLFSLASKSYIVELPGRPAEWRQVGFFHDPKPEPGATAERIVGITQEGEMFSWPYFPDLRGLKQYAADNLPFVGNERMPIRADVACRIKAKPESECPSIQDDPGQD
jgi:WD40 repeat protein/energy-coupling factor transporter ATP-binding protein EcfA2